MKLRRGALIGCGVAAGTIPALLSVGDSAESTPASNQSVPTGTYTEDQAISDGYLTRQVSQLPDGGSLYSYAGQDGTSTLQIPVPPSGFSPLTATPSQLQEYGFPPRPSGGTALQSWLQAMQAYTGVPNPSLVIKVTPASNQNNQLQSGTPSSTAPAPAGPQVSPNWSGWAGLGGSTTYVALSGNSTVPTEAGAGCANNAYTDWTGLGGTSFSLPLIQSGIDFNNLVPDAWVPFYEVIMANNQGNIHSTIGEPPFHLSDGDGVYFYTDYQQSNDVADFFVMDTTTGQTAPFRKTGVPSSYYDGSSAEWINEAFISNSGAYIPPKEYSPFGWSNMQEELSDGNWKSPGSVSNEKFYTIRNGDLIQYPSASLSGGDAYTQYWAACS